MLITDVLVSCSSMDARRVASITHTERTDDYCRTMTIYSSPCIKGWLGTRERSAVQVSPKTAISELFPDSDFLVSYILENREVQGIFAYVIT